MTKKYRVKANNRYNYWSLQAHNLRRIWSDSDPERAKCFANARVRVVGTSYTYRCVKCNGEFEHTPFNKQVQCDHIVPIGNSQPQTREEFFDFAEKTLVKFHKLQILCLKCHQQKTNNESETSRNSHDTIS